MPLALGICALLLIACGCFRVITAQTRTSRVVARWLEGAHPLQDRCRAQTVTFRSQTRGTATHLGGCAQTKSTGFGIYGCASESRRTATSRSSMNSRTCALATT